MLWEKKEKPGVSGHQKPVINSSNHLNRPTAHPCSAWPWALLKQALERLLAAEGPGADSMRSPAQRNRLSAVCVTLICKVRFPKCHIIECGRVPAVHSDVHIDSNTVNNK